MSDTTSSAAPAGLNAWIKKRAAAGPAEGQGSGTPLDVALDLLDPNPEQPRDEMDPDELAELKESLRTYGFIQPLSVTRKADGRYTIIAGHRRWTAAKMLRDEAGDEATRAKWSKVPATDRGPTAVEDLAELAIAENLQRSDLRPVETAKAIAKLQAAKALSTEQLAERLSMDLTKTKRYLQLANAPQAIREALDKGLMVEVDAESPTPTGKPRREHRRLEMGHALLVLRAYNHWSRERPKKAADLARALTDKVLGEGWPHRKLKDHVDHLLAGRPAPEPGPEGEGIAPPPPRPAPALFQSDESRLVVHRNRLATASPADRTELRSVLSELLKQLS